MTLKHGFKKYSMDKTFDGPFSKMSLASKRNGESAPSKFGGPHSPREIVARDCRFLSGDLWRQLFGSTVLAASMDDRALISVSSLLVRRPITDIIHG